MRVLLFSLQYYDAGHAGILARTKIYKRTLPSSLLKVVASTPI